MRRGRSDCTRLIQLHSYLLIRMLWITPAKRVVNITLGLNANSSLLLIQAQNRLISRLVDIIAPTYLTSAATAFCQRFDQ